MFFIETNFEWINNSPESYVGKQLYPKYSNDRSNKQAWVEAGNHKAKVPGG